MTWLKYLTAATVPMGPFVDDTDGKTAETGLTISQGDIRLSKNGGAFAQIAGTANAAHGTLGWYMVVLGTADTNTVGRLTVTVHESGALPVWRELQVVPALVYDSLVAGSDNLQVDAIQISGDSTAADNAELFYDGTGYDAANSTIGTVTNLTNFAGTVTATVGGTISANVVQIAGAAVSTSTAQLGVNAVQISGDGTAADNLEASAEAIVTGTATASTLSTTQMSTNLSEATNDHYNGRVVIWRTGNLAGQACAITDYDGASKTLTFTTATEAPAENDTFVIV